MNTRRTLVTASLLALSSAAFAGDPLVWDNGDMYVPVWALYSPQVTETGIDNAIADDFVIEQDTYVTSLEWSGVVEHLNNFPSAFVIEFYASDPSGTTPAHGVGDPSGIALASYTIQVGEIDMTPLEPSPTEFFNFAASLPAPFVAKGGDHYWVSIQAYLANAGGYGWIMSETLQLNNLATETDGIWETFEFGEGDYVGDLAFKLYGTPVPGPGALALLGVAALVKSRRRRR